MSVFRALVIFAFSVLPFFGATFGTVVARPQPAADLAIDNARRRLYVVSTASNQVDVYNIAVTPPTRIATINTDQTPLAVAVAKSGRSLYVACYGSSSLVIVDLTVAGFPSRSVTLPAPPQGLAVGFNDKVLISTSGTSTGQGILLTYDPSAAATQAVQAVVIAPPAPGLPTLPPPNGQMSLAARGILKASADGRTIVGVHNLANNQRALFVFDVESSTILGSRVFGPITPVLAVSPDGSRFMAGANLFESSTMLMLGQQNVINSPHVFPPGANFTIQTTQGGAIFAQLASGPALVAAYNIIPVQSPAARANTGQLLISSPDNLLIRMGIQLPESLSGKMEITADNSTIYAVSQSGFIVLPIAGPQASSLSQLPLGMPDSNVALLASDQCGVTSAETSAVIPVRNLGGGRLTVTTQVQAASPTAATVRATARPYGGDITATFSAGAARLIGTSNPDTLLIQAAEAVNIIPNVRVFQNNRNAEARGKIMPVDIGATPTGLTDMVTDSLRQRLYIANPGKNRVEVFDIRRQEFLSPIGVGQLPRSLALAGDGNTLYVANSGSETISIVDVVEGAVIGRVKYPPIPFNATFPVITPQAVANSQRGPHVIMSDGTLWKIVGDSLTPRTLNTNIFGNLRTLPLPLSMAATPDGSFVLVLAGNGAAYLYDSSADDFVSTRTVISPPILGYFGPIAAGPGGLYYLVNGDVLNQALTSIGTGAGGTGPIGGGPLPLPGGPIVTTRPVPAVAAGNAQSFLRFSIPIRANAAAVPPDAGMVEMVNVATQQVMATAQTLEGPLNPIIGNGRANANPRTMAVDAAGANAYLITASGLSVVPLTPVAPANAPQLLGSPVVNAANFTSAVAPGGLISIFGRNLAANASAEGASTLPTILGGVCVTLNNAPLPLLASSPGQINAQLPPTLAPGRYPLVVRSIASQTASSVANITVARYAPAVFLDANGPAIFHQDGRRVNKQNPAKRDEPLTIFATGLGVTTGGRVTAGAPSPSSPLAVTAKVSLFFGLPTIREAPVIVDWSGLQPGTIGVYMINCRIPGAHINGEALPVTIRIGGVDSPRTGPGAATVAVN